MVRITSAVIATLVIGTASFGMSLDRRVEATTTALEFIDRRQDRVEGTIAERLESLESKIDRIQEMLNR